MCVKAEDGRMQSDSPFIFFFGLGWKGKGVKMGNGLG